MLARTVSENRKASSATSRSRRRSEAEGQLAHVVAADEDGAVRDVVEAGQEQRDGRLAGAGRADHGDGLAGGDVEREAVKDGPLVVVAEAHVVEFDGGGSVGGQFLRAVRHGRLGVDQLKDAFDAGPGLLADGEHHGEHADGPDELGEVGGERDERTERDLAAGGEPAAEGQHADLAECGDGLEGGGVAGVQLDRAQAAREQPCARLSQLAGLLVLLAEALDDADPGHRAVDDPGDGGLPAGRTRWRGRGGCGCAWR